jgi:hypothetical protein
MKHANSSQLFVYSFRKLEGAGVEIVLKQKREVCLSRFEASGRGQEEAGAEVQVLLLVCDFG